MLGTEGEPSEGGPLKMTVADPPPVSPQSERDELTQDGEGSIRSSEEGPGDSGEPERLPRHRERVGKALLEASHSALPLVSPVFTAPAESEGSGPEEKSPGQQVSLELAWSPQATSCH